MHHLPHLRPSGVLPPPSISPQGQEPAAGTASCRKPEAGSSTEVLLDTLCTSDTGEALAFRGPQTHLHSSSWLGAKTNERGIPKCYAW